MHHEEAEEAEKAMDDDTEDSDDAVDREGGWRHCDAVGDSDSLDGTASVVAISAMMQTCKRC